MGYNGPNPNKLVGGALCRPLVAQLMRHNEGDILVVVSTGNDMWWEHGRKTCAWLRPTRRRKMSVYNKSLSPFNNMVDRDVQADWHGSIWIHLKEIVLIRLEKVKWNATDLMTTSNVLVCYVYLSPESSFNSKNLIKWIKIHLSWSYATVYLTQHTI